MKLQKKMIFILHWVEKIFCLEISEKISAFLGIF